MNTIKYECHHQVFWITLSRVEKRNAFNPLLLDELYQAIQMALDLSEVKAICLQAEGDFFSAGADLSTMKNIATSTWDENFNNAKQLAEVLLVWYQSPKPTLCIVQGDAYGGALGFIAASDYVIANEQTQFCFSEARLGLIPAIISPYILETMGWKQTKRWFLSAQNFSAQSALSYQLLDEIMPAYELMARAEIILNHWTQLPKESVQIIKPWLFEIQNQRIDEHLVLKTAEKLARIRSTKIAQELLMAFLNSKTKG